MLYLAYFTTWCSGNSLINSIIKTIKHFINNLQSIVPLHKQRFFEQLKVKHKLKYYRLNLKE